MKDSYNQILFQKRNELGLKRKQFARLLGINRFSYMLIENGYIKPNKKQVEKISSYLNEDYSLYLEGISSYPTEMEAKEGKLSKFLYTLLGKRWLRITSLVLVFLFLSQTVACYFIQAAVNDNTGRYYDDDFVKVVDTIREEGSTSLSLLDDLTSPLIIETEKDGKGKTISMVRIKVSEENSDYDSVITISDYWNEINELDTRMTFKLESAKNNEITGESSLLVNDFYISLDVDFTITQDGLQYDKEMLKNATDTGLEILDLLMKDLFDYYREFANDCLIKDLDNLLKNKGHTNMTTYEFMEKETRGSSNQSRDNALISIFRYLGIVLMGTSIFVFVFALIYGEKNKVRRKFSNSDELLFAGRDNAQKIKKDWKFTPFLPETVFEIIGIILVSFGSIRILYYFFAVIGVMPATQENLVTIPRQLLSYYLIGMFLLYFIDFDLFLNDKRVIRNCVMYALIFFGLYIIESELAIFLTETPNVIIKNFSSIMIPNVFMSVSNYFAIMLFLFFTPRRIKTKRGLIIYRSLAIIPIAYIILSYFLYHGNVFFGWNMPIHLQYLFSSEKLPFSILAISYLVGYFFLRLFYKHKYGEEAATRFFNGNKFIIIKNILICLIIIIIAAIEFSLQGNHFAASIGLGKNANIIFLAPIILFYHPHKGSRNLVVDYITLFLYGLAITFGYIFIIGTLFFI